MKTRRTAYTRAIMEKTYKISHVFSCGIYKEVKVYSEKRCVCELGFEVASNECWRCEYCLRRTHDLRRPPFTIECGLQGKRKKKRGTESL